MISGSWLTRPLTRVRWRLARLIAPVYIVAMPGDALLVLREGDAELVLYPTSIKIRQRLSLTGRGSRGTFVGTFERP